MQAKYKINILGCILELKARGLGPDFETASRWLTEAHASLAQSEFQLLVNAILDELVDACDLEGFDWFAEQIRLQEYSFLVFDADSSREQLIALQQRRKIEEEARLAELEKERQEKERLQNWKRARRELQNCLEHHFLDIHQRYSKEWRQFIDEKEFKKVTTEFVIGWFQMAQLGDQNKKIRKPGIDQAWAIATGTQNTLVVARAGSGKTTIVVYRAYFLSEHCGISPHEMLILAFNRDAVDEIKDRLLILTGNQWPFVMTFHALAYGIVQPGENLIYDDDARKAQSSIVQEVISDRIRQGDLKPCIRELMLLRWKSDWERIVEGGDDKSKSEFLKYRRSLQRETLGREYVKSHGEKVIANCLFEFGLDYRYERPQVWGERRYRPDFTVFRNNSRKEGLIIEYFGMQGDPEYDEQMDAKRAHLAASRKWTLVEVTPKDVVRPDFEQWFVGKIRAHGIQCNKLTEEQIWEKAETRAIDSFSETMKNFVCRARKENLDIEGLKERVSQFKASSQVESLFCELAIEFYSDYIARLSDGLEDFDGLMIRAAEAVKKGNTRFNRKDGSGDLRNFRFISIDEFQDFSLLFHNLIEVVRQQNEAVSIFSVGDDWQAINGFAGSDLRYYREFESLFPDSIRVTIPTNYRSASRIVSLGNRLMRDGNQESVADRDTPGQIFCIDIAKLILSPAELENQLRDADAAILRLVKAGLDHASPIVDRVPDKQAVAVLSRTKRTTSGTTLVKLSEQLEDDDRRLVRLKTSHSFKGKQAYTTIISDAMLNRYPLVHPDWIFTRIFGDTVEKIVEAEKRLFYVAITRAEDNLVLLIDSSRSEPCPFLAELSVSENLFWSQLPSRIDNYSATVVQVGNNNYPWSSPPTYKIKDELKQQGFQWKGSGTWKHWRKTYGNELNSMEEFLNSSRIDWPDGIEIRVLDGNEQVVERIEFRYGRKEKLPIASRPETGRKTSSKRYRRSSLGELPF